MLLVLRLLKVLFTTRATPPLSSPSMDSIPVNDKDFCAGSASFVIEEYARNWSNNALLLVFLTSNEYSDALEVRTSCYKTKQFSNSNKIVYILRIDKKHFETFRIQS